MQKPSDVLVFSHTHWDREWYKTFQEFRFALVDVIEQVISLVQAREYEYFILDGQTIILEDYLEIRPALKETISKRIKNGKVVIGPWYILPDEFLVSGESLVRNLLFGKKISVDFGKYQNIGYLPDMFGHISQIPQILKGFGIEKAVIWRGVNPKNNLFIWQGLDNTETLTVHLSEGYYNVLLIDYENQKNNLEAHLDKLKEKSYNKNLILFPNGGDHLAPIENLNDIIEDANSNLNNYRLKQATIEEYFNLLEYDREKLEIIKGELKETYDISYILSGVFSARTYLKQLNFKIQSLISNWVEPLSTISWLIGNDYNEGFINLVWKNLLKNQPHDSICGCSTDQVHKEMIYRYDETEQICNKMINKSMFSIAESLGLEKDNDYLVFFNTFSNNVYTIEEVTLDFLESENVSEITLESLDRKEISYELISKTNMKKFISEIDVLPDWIKIDRFVIHLKIDNIDAVSNKVIKVIKNKPKSLITSSDIKITENSIENNIIKIEIKNGELLAKNLETEEYFSLNNFYTSGDVGDEYNYSPPKEDFLRYAIIKSFEIIKKSSFISVIKIEYELEYFEEINDLRTKHNEKKVINNITTEITIKSNDPIIYFKTIVDNKSKDHRLRVSFGSNFEVSENTIKSYYDTHFGILEKSTEVNKRPFDMPKRSERIEETFTVQNFANLNDSFSGMNVITKGIPEFEITDLKNKKELSLTLIRAVGWLSRDDLRTRGGGAGPSFETPDAQCLGKNVFEYSVHLYNNDFDNNFYSTKNAYQVNNGVKFFQYKPKNNTKVSIKKSLFEVSPENIIVSAIKRSENENGFIVRFFNASNETQKFIIKPSDELYFSNVYKVRLDETHQKELFAKNNAFSDTIKPFEIVSLCFNTIDSDDV